MNQDNRIKGTESNPLPLPPLERGIRNFPVAPPPYPSERFQRSDSVATFYFSPFNIRWTGRIYFRIADFGFRIVGWEVANRERERPATF